jgi:hypothetical protein
MTPRKARATVHKYSTLRAGYAVNTRKKEPPMSVITSSGDRLPRVASRARALLILTYSTGAAALAGEAVVHIQQYVALLHFVPWIGPLFLAQSAACAAIIIGLAFRPTRQLSALGGVIISALALGGLVVSYGQALFGWQETGFRTSIAVAVITEVVATIALTFALAVAAARPRETIGGRALYG